MLRIHDIETARKFIVRYYDATLSAVETEALVHFLNERRGSLPDDVELEGEAIRAIATLAPSPSDFRIPDGLEARLASAIDSCPDSPQVPEVAVSRPRRRLFVGGLAAAVAAAVAVMLLLPVATPDSITPTPGIASVSDRPLFSKPDPVIDVKPMMKCTASYTNSVSRTNASPSMDSETGARIAVSAVKIVSANLSIADQSIVATSDNISRIHRKIKSIFK